MKNWIKKLDIIINGVDTPLGRTFDIVLILAIISNSVLIILDSVESIHSQFGSILNLLQMAFLVIFTIEFILRLIVSPRNRNYIFSFYGIVDILSIVPIYLSSFFSFGRFSPIIRTLRLLRLFSVLKMGRYMRESGSLLKALRASRTKITIFIYTILFIIIIVGTLMYTIEGPANGFTNIPEAMYWAVVTISTVGYGDLSPQTGIGKLIASGLMLVGYGIIAVPTGIITSEITKEHYKSKDKLRLICNHCGNLNHFDTAQYCHNCGKKMNEQKTRHP